ncbi:unnamed protein product [Dibothriocephalus latus]|uniref:Uncharacterized protein n=1 Tax=Dibothriocephalus latus TaxID=60516 RepID=A0A3P7PFQ3_DIBLA|nr:unnamed protein product [Dibothriocephalus latus]
MPALVLIRVRIQDLYTLRNAIYKSLSVLEKGYNGTYVGISNDAERVPPCESQPLLNFGMGLFYFTNEADARRFIYSDQGFLESDFLECSDMMIIPMAKPMHLNTSKWRLIRCVQFLRTARTIGQKLVGRIRAVLKLYGNLFLVCLKHKFAVKRVLGSFNVILPNREKALRP